MHTIPASVLHIDGLVQERCNSSSLAMELHLSSTNPSIWHRSLNFGHYPKDLNLAIISVQKSKARLLSLARSKLRLCSANHRAGYFSNLACDWLSLVWAYSEQETENGPNSRGMPRNYRPLIVTKSVHYIAECLLLGSHRFNSTYRPLWSLMISQL